MLVNIHHLPNLAGSQCWNLVEPPIFLRWTTQLGPAGCPASFTSWGCSFVYDTRDERGARSGHPARCWSNLPDLVKPTGWMVDSCTVKLRYFENEHMLKDDDSLSCPGRCFFGVRVCFFFSVLRNNGLSEMSYAVGSPEFLNTFGGQLEYQPEMK